MIVAGFSQMEPHLCEFFLLFVTIYFVGDPIIKREIEIPLRCLTPQYFGVCPVPGPGCQTPYVRFSSFFVFNGLMSEVFVFNSFF